MIPLSRHSRDERSWWGRRSTAAKIGMLAGGLAALGCAAGAALIPTSSPDAPGGAATERAVAPVPTTAASSATEPEPSASASPAPDPTSAELTSPSATAKPPPRPSPSTARTSRAPSIDPRYDSCREARAHGYGPYYKGVDPEYYWYRDPNKDGVVCD